MRNYIQASAAVGKELLQHPILATFTAVIMLIFEYGFNSNKVVFVTFIIFASLIALDWLSGTAAAKRDGIDTSKYGIDGVKRTVFLLALPCIARLIDITAGTEVVIMGLVIGVLARSVARSVIANIKRAKWNVYIPDALLEWVADELEQKDARALRRLAEKTKTTTGGKNNE